MRGVLYAEGWAAGQTHRVHQQDTELGPVGNLLQVGTVKVFSELPPFPSRSPQTFSTNRFLSLGLRKKIQLMRIEGVKEIQERRLFHGTTFGNIDSICKHNFDLRLAGQHGHVYGKGKLSDEG